MAQYTAEVLWLRGEQKFVDNRYSRRHAWRFDGGVEVRGSSSPHVVPLPFSDAAAVDPEEAFVTSLASCHMLWFLAIAAREGFRVDRYFDRAAGTMAKNAEGKLAMTLVTLRPETSFSGERVPTREQIEHMHHEAHEACFIANSVRTTVRCEPVYSKRQEGAADDPAVATREPTQDLRLSSMKTLLLVYHSTTGGTLQMARAAAAGAANETGLRVRLLHAPAATEADVLDADAYVFATPENLAAMSGLMKDFFDRCYYAALERVNGRPYAMLICAGSDGQNAARQIERIATGWRLKLVAPALIVCTHAQTPEEILRAKQIVPEDLKRCEELGAALAAGLMLGVF